GAERDILATLMRYGFAHDGEIVRQSERAGLYAKALERLDARGWLFACACTRSDLATAPLAPTGERVYPGTCRRGVAPGRTASSLRVRAGRARGAGGAARGAGGSRSRSSTGCKARSSRISRSRWATSSCAAPTASRR